MHAQSVKTPRALIVDSDPAAATAIAAQLQARGWEVRCAAAGDAGLAVARAFHPDLIFLDATIPQQSGWLVCAKLKLFGPGPSVVLMTGRVTEQLSSFAAVVGADRVLEKPISAEDLQSLTAALAPAA
jgi:two-component system, OmpR family, response regulator